MEVIAGGERPRMCVEDSERLCDCDGPWLRNDEPGVEYADLGIGVLVLGPVDPVLTCGREPETQYDGTV